MRKFNTAFESRPAHPGLQGFGEDLFGAASHPMAQRDEELTPEELTALLGSFMPEIPGYRVLRRIGKGGMSQVYLGVQESLDRQVAVKVMSPAAP